MKSDGDTIDGGDSDGHVDGWERCGIMSASMSRTEWQGFIVSSKGVIGLGEDGGDNFCGMSSARYKPSSAALSSPERPPWSHLGHKTNPSLNLVCGILIFRARSRRTVTSLWLWRVLSACRHHADGSLLSIERCSRSVSCIEQTNTNGSYSPRYYTPRWAVSDGERCFNS
jgi:hypothetical protein